MSFGRILIVLGIVLVVIGVLTTLGVRVGRLPGDIEIRGKNSVFYFPVMTCIVVSVVLSLLMWLLRR
jgi:Protein of unknown function (DUF2905)